jgi:hypothetical protein
LAQVVALFLGTAQTRTAVHLLFCLTTLELVAVLVVVGHLVAVAVVEVLEVLAAAVVAVLVKALVEAGLHIYQTLNILETTAAQVTLPTTLQVEAEA